jgi:hypothetical protein
VICNGKEILFETEHKKLPKETQTQKFSFQKKLKHRNSHLTQLLQHLYELKRKLTHNLFTGEIISMKKLIINLTKKEFKKCANLSIELTPCGKFKSYLRASNYTYLEGRTIFVRMFRGKEFYVSKMSQI